jgi:hypothetical protein
MQTNECTYCGATLDHTVYQCTNCGGLVKQLTSANPKQKKQTLLFGLLLVVIVISPFIYKTHLKNTATAVIDKFQTETIQPPSATQTPVTPLQKSEAANENFFVKKVKFIQVLSQVTPIKFVTHEFYVTQGRYAVSLDELGFNEQSFDTGKLIQKIHISKTGEIRIELDTDTFGNRKHLIFTPKEIMGGMNIQWTCSSNLERNIVPFQCESTA